MQQTIHQAAIGAAVTLWWDLPEEAQADSVYQVVLSGKTVAETRRTHCTLSEIHAPADCEVYLDGQRLGRTEVRPGPVYPRRNARDFGAAGDGATLDTAALQRAIDACGPGEELWLPAGVYRTGALRLHSDMALYLEAGAVLQGTDNPEDYLPKIPSRFEGTEMECYQSVLNLGEMDHAAGPNCRNVLIHGEGEIRGGGQPLALAIIEAEKERLRDELAALGDRIREYENDHTIPGRARGRLINLSNCENVRITGLTLQDGASWNVHMLYSRGIVTDHCVFRSEAVWNGDGWDPDSSEDCTLFASKFYTGDDSVAIKSGKNPEGNVINRPTKHIRVFDCYSHAGLGIAIGSEMSGGVEDVAIWHCDLEHSLSGIQIKGTKKRGGFVRGIRVSDCVISRFLVCAVKYNDDGEGSPVPPQFSDMRVTRTHLTGWAHNYWEKEDRRIEAIDLAGFDEPGCAARDIHFEACTLGPEATVRLSHCEAVTLDLARTDA